MDLDLSLKEFGEKAASYALDEITYKDKTIREWVDFISNNADDLISRDEAISSAYWYGDNATRDNPYPEGAEAVDVADLVALPSVCPEQKTGKWICIAGDVMCSECKFQINDPFYLGKGLAYPNCGIPMSGGLREYYGIEE